MEKDLPAVGRDILLLLIFNPAIEKQAQDRAIRRDQPKTVYVDIIYTNNSYDMRTRWIRGRRISIAINVSDLDD